MCCSLTAADEETQESFDTLLTIKKDGYVVKHKSVFITCGLLLQRIIGEGDDKGYGRRRSGQQRQAGEKREGRRGSSLTNSDDKWHEGESKETGNIFVFGEKYDTCISSSGPVYTLFYVPSDEWLEGEHIRHKEGGGGGWGEEVIGKRQPHKAKSNVVAYYARIIRLLITPSPRERETLLLYKMVFSKHLL